MQKTDFQTFCPATSEKVSGAAPGSCSQHSFALLSLSFRKASSQDDTWQAESGEGCIRRVLGTLRLGCRCGGCRQPPDPDAEHAGVPRLSRGDAHQLPALPPAPRALTPHGLGWGPQIQGVDPGRKMRRVEVSTVPWAQHQ